MSKEIYVDHKSSRQGYWTSFESGPHLTIAKRNIYGRCVPCMENLLDQLVEGRGEIELKQAFDCWKVVAVLNDEKECLAALERYGQRSPASRYVCGKIGSKEESGTKGGHIPSQSSTPNFQSRAKTRPRNCLKILAVAPQITLP